MKKLFLILIVLIGLILSSNNVFALTTIVDVNINYVRVPTWYYTCYESDRGSSTYINGQNQYIELTHNQNYVAGKIFSELKASNTSQTEVTFAFERENEKTYDLRISILPLRINVFKDFTGMINNSTANINCQLNQTLGIKDALSVIDAWPGTGGSYGCISPSKARVNNLEIERNCDSPIAASGEYAYPIETYSHKNWNSTTNQWEYPKELDPHYPRRYCIELGQIGPI